MNRIFQLINYNNKKLAPILFAFAVLSTSCNHTIYDKLFQNSSSINTVTYNANGSTSGEPPVDLTDYISGQTVVVLANTGSLLRTGYIFTGWNTASDGSGSTYTSGQTFGIGMSPVTLYAKWSVISLISSQIFTNARNIALSGNIAYVAGGSSFYVYDVSNPVVPLLSGSKTLPDQVDEISVSGGYVYVGVYSSSSLQIFNTFSPYASVSSCNAIGNNWIYGLNVSGNYAYVALGNRYFGIYDISTPAIPLFIGNCGIGGTIGNSFDLDVSGIYAYVGQDNVGLKIIDITTITAPVVIGTCTINIYVNGVTVSGNYAYLAAGTSGLVIIDISNPVSPVLISTCDTPGSAIEVEIVGDYAFVADSASGLQVIDISDPANPRIAGSYSTGGNADGVKISGQYIYVADGVGLKIIYCSAL